MPFPSPRLIALPLGVNVSDNVEAGVILNKPYTPTKIPNPLRSEDRRQAMLLSHFAEEEYLMPFWIRHHAHMFDSAVLIDFEAADSTRKIVEEIAPTSWKVINSVTGASFEAARVDDQVVELEKSRPQDWHLALTTTEFLVHRNFRQGLAKHESEEKARFCHVRSFGIVGDDAKAVKKVEELSVQRSVYAEGEGRKGKREENNTYSKSFPLNRYLLTSPYRRFLHLNTLGKFNYRPGRHAMFPAPQEDDKFDCEAFIMKYQWTPWPEIIKRKLMVGQHIPPGDKNLRRGVQHTAVVDEKTLDEARQFDLQGLPLYDLKDLRCAVPERCPYHRIYQETYSPSEFKVTASQSKRYWGE